MKILITGGSGLLGQYLNSKLSKEYDILTLYNSNEGNCNKYNSLKINLTDFYELKKIFISFNPDIVLHTAAISRPELCDALPENFVIDVNVNSTDLLAGLCESTGSKLIFTSTDLVYDGSRGQMLNEDAALKPVSLYAETKVRSEDIIKKKFENYIILRTSLLYGIGLNHSTNNFHVMYNNFLQNKKTKLFYDQFRTPLSLNDASRLIELLLKTDVKNITLNFGGRERVSRVELGEILCNVGKFDKSLIEKISMHEIPALHKVADVSMDTSLLQSFGLKPKSIEESISLIVNR